MQTLGGSKIWYKYQRAWHSVGEKRKDSPTWMQRLGEQQVQQLGERAGSSADPPSTPSLCSHHEGPSQVGWAGGEGTLCSF